MLLLRILERALTINWKYLGTVLHFINFVLQFYEFYNLFALHFVLSCPSCVKQFPSTKIDETLSESINILKNDYEKKVNDVQTQLDAFKQESKEERYNSEKNLENLMINKINEVNDNLMEQMSKIYHSSIKSETTLMKKIEDMEESIKQINENFENMTVQLEDVQEKMYDFEQNKKNNLIFYGVPGDGRESKDDLKHKICNLLKLRLNIRREIPVLRASRMLTGD